MRVLVVDDDPSIRHLLATSLRMADVDVREAANGDDALTAVESDCPDLILLDLIMPRRDGLETLCRIRAGHPDLLIFAMSGGGRSRNFEPLSIAADAGATLTIKKPFKINELVRLVKTQIALSRH